MRYWLLVILMNVLFWLIVKHVAPEWYGSPGYYAGQIICTLIAAVITWRDPPDWLDGIRLCFPRLTFLRWLWWPRAAAVWSGKTCSAKSRN